jgi:hypothetical protein
MRTPLLALSLLALAVSTAQAGVARIYAVSDGEKIERDASGGPLAEKNAVWDGTRVRLFGARNEILAFQVIVEADPSGIGALSLSLPELRQRGGGSRIRYSSPGADPSHSVGRDIQIFGLHYLNVTQTTRAGWAWKPETPAAPADTLGWKPVQLVPENARKGRGGFPLKVAAAQNQSLWVEIYTGRERPAGIYEGTLTVTADGTKKALPVELEVLDFALPEANSLDAMVYYESTQPALYHGRNLDAEYHRFAHRHRVELVTGFDEAAVRQNLSRFKGTDFTREKGYDGPGLGVGNRIVPRSFYGPGEGFDEPETARTQSDAWMTFLQSTLPQARTFLYMPDEPGPSEYPRILKIAANVHENPGPGRKLPIFVTSSWKEALDPAIDFWCAGPQHIDVARVAKEKAKGRNYCFYNGGRPHGPTPIIDAPATEARAVAWAAFKHDFDLYFYWHGVHWQHNSQKQGERHQDVWIEPITFDNRGQPRKPVTDQGILNGDGVLFYPGEERVHPREDRGIAGPVGSVQLANLRRGLQDHLYLTLARQRGQTAVVDEVLQAIVPKVFSDAGATVSFPESGEAYEAARRKLGQAIAGAKVPAR